MNFDEYPDLYKPLILQCGFDEMILLLETKKSFSMVILESMNDIPCFKLTINNQLTNFIGNLISLKQFDVIKKLITIINDYDNNYYDFLFDLFYKNRAISEYLKICPENRKIDEFSENIYNKCYNISYIDNIVFILYEIRLYSDNNNKYEFINCIKKYWLKDKKTYLCDSYLTKDKINYIDNILSEI